MRCVRAEHWVRRVGCSLPSRPWRSSRGGAARRGVRARARGPRRSGGAASSGASRAAVQALLWWTTGRSVRRHEEGTLVATSAEPQLSSDTPTTLTLTNSSGSCGPSDNGGVPGDGPCPPGGHSCSAHRGEQGQDGESPPSGQAGALHGRSSVPRDLR